MSRPRTSGGASGRPRGLVFARWVVLASGLSAAHCFHRFAEDEALLSTASSAGTESGGEGGEPAAGGRGGSAGRGSSGGADASSSGDGGSSNGGRGGDGSGGGGATGGTVGGAASAGSAGSDGGTPATGGDAATAGHTNGGSTMTSGSTGLGGASAGSGPSDAGAGGESANVPPPQCEQPAGTLRTVLSDGFESYPTGSLPYELGTPAWLRAEEGDASISEGNWVASGLRSFRLSSYTPRSEIAYIGLGLRGPPRRIVLELRYTPVAGVVFLDFAELGLGIARSKFDMMPSVALEVNDHVLELRANPDKPQASTNGHGSIPAAIKPPFVVLFNEVEHLTTPVHNHFRFDFDFCTGIVSAYIGTDANPPFRGSGSFDGSRAVEVLYLAGGLNDTYIDDITVQADDE